MRDNLSSVICEKKFKKVEKSAEDDSKKVAFVLLLFAF